LLSLVHYYFSYLNGTRAKKYWHRFCLDIT
jgi:hypothetical protein